jgi:hypothetical protein
MKSSKSPAPSRHPFDEQTDSGTVTEGKRQIVVTAEAIHAIGYNDGYADSLSLIITAD